MFRRLSIKSKFLLMLLGASVASLLIISLLAFFQTGDALSDSAVERLTNQRTMQSARLAEYLETTERQAKTLSADRMIIEAMLELRIGFSQLEGRTLDDAVTAESNAFYERFLGDFGADAAPEAVEFHRPTTIAGQYLQSQYVTSDRTDPASIESTGDGTFYDRTHERFHPVLRDFTDTFGYHDLYLVDANSKSIVYSVEKEIDFGTGLASGPYANSPLGAVVDASLRQAEPSDVSFVDFDFYRPSKDLPAAFLASPIVANGGVVGVLALRLSDQEIDRVMTADGSWRSAGFGDTGETYAVGPDLTMRSRARLLTNSPETFFNQLRSANVPAASIDAIERTGSTLLTQPVPFTGARTAIERGRNGTTVATNYRGVDVLASFGPVAFEKLDWAVVAEVELDEARDAQRTLQRNLLAAAGLIVLILTALAVPLATSFTDPISRLTHWAEAIADGDTTVEPPPQSDDEFGALTASISRMMSSLNEQTTLVEKQNDENERLLTTLMPASVAERLRRGEENIADEHPDAVVIVLRILGLSDMASKLEAKDTVEMVNQLVSAFDDAAESLHIEKIRTVSDTYMAACGLSERRLDQPRMAVEFVIEAMRAVDRYVAGSGMKLGLRAGISEGLVEAGLIGRMKPVYEIVGEPVDSAVALAAAAATGQILVTTDIKSRLEDLYAFVEGDPLEISGKPIGVWEVQQQVHEEVDV